MRSISQLVSKSSSSSPNGLISCSATCTTRGWSYRPDRADQCTHLIKSYVNEMGSKHPILAGEIPAKVFHIEGRCAKHMSHYLVQPMENHHLRKCFQPVSTPHFTYNFHHKCILLRTKQPRNDPQPRQNRLQMKKMDFGVTL